MTTAENVDPIEIQKFEDMARRWWDPDSEFKPLHAINPLRMHYIAERATLAGKRVLDIGCGGGLLTEALATAEASVTGIDMGTLPFRSPSFTNTSPILRSSISSRPQRIMLNNTLAPLTL